MEAHRKSQSLVKLSEIVLYARFIPILLIHRKKIKGTSHLDDLKYELKKPKTKQK